jgi:hypothetical protein
MTGKKSCLMEVHVSVGFYENTELDRSFRGA